MSEKPHRKMSFDDYNVEVGARALAKYYYPKRSPDFTLPKDLDPNEEPLWLQYKIDAQVVLAAVFDRPLPVRDTTTLRLPDGTRVPYPPKP